MGARRLSGQNGSFHTTIPERGRHVIPQCQALGTQHPSTRHRTRRYRDSRDGPSATRDRRGPRPRNARHQARPPGHSASGAKPALSSRSAARYTLATWRPKSSGSRSASAVAAARDQSSAACAATERRSRPSSARLWPPPATSADCEIGSTEGGVLSGKDSRSAMSRPQLRERQCKPRFGCAPVPFGSQHVPTDIRPEILTAHRATGHLFDDRTVLGRDSPPLFFPLAYSPFANSKCSCQDRLRADYACSSI